jgi:hypothetical protein
MADAKEQQISPEDAVSAVSAYFELKDTPVEVQYAGAEFPHVDQGVVYETVACTWLQVGNWQIGMHQAVDSMAQTLNARQHRIQQADGFVHWKLVPDYNNMQSGTSWTLTVRICYPGEPAPAQDKLPMAQPPDPSDLM